MMSKEIQIEKQLQRAMAKKARESLTAAERTEYSRLVCEKLIAHPALSSASVILSYMAFGSELDLSALHEEMIKKGKTLAFPVPYGDGRMEAYQPCTPEGWTVGVFGIQTPREDASLYIPPEIIDVVLVPCVAFDDACRRIGWGGGYYDRYLPRCRQAFTIGVAFEIQRLGSAAADPTRDVRLNEVITERRS
jgi:5-formyltetrahydrofolate cyclo-ligase